MIDLLVALSLIALVTAGVMLAASARAEVQRRLGAIGVRRAVGATRGQVVLAQVVEAADRRGAGGDGREWPPGRSPPTRPRPGC